MRLIKMDAELLEEIKQRILINQEIELTDEYVDEANCYTYALNVNLPIRISVGDISGENDDSIPSKDFEHLFIDDCTMLDIDVKKVSKHYKIAKDNEWLVALFVTDFFDFYNRRFCDFHFIKKNYNSEWVNKYSGRYPKYTDACGKELKDIENMTFATKDSHGNLVYYDYVGTYRLKIDSNNKRI